MNDYRAERFERYAETLDAQGAPTTAYDRAQCRMCRLNLYGEDLRLSWRLSTPWGDAWGYEVILCESCAGDIAHMAAAVALAESIEQVDTWEDTVTR